MDSGSSENKQRLSFFLEGDEDPFLAQIRLLHKSNIKHILRLWARVFADVAAVEAGLGWAEQPGWQGPVLSTRKALIQKTRSPGEQRQQYGEKKKKKTLENNKTTLKSLKKKVRGWLPAALQITRLSESLSAILLKEL